MFLFSRNPQEHVKFAEPFVAEMAARGVLLRRDVNFISSAHTEAHIVHTIQAAQGALSAMQRAGLFAAQAAQVTAGATA
jgi:aminotransferase MxcL